MYNAIHITKYNGSKPIIIVNNQNSLRSFINDCKTIYNCIDNSNIISYFCIDFEFNMNRIKRKRYISLMQIMFIFNSKKYFMDQMVLITNIYTMYY